MYRPRLVVVCLAAAGLTAGCTNRPAPIVTQQEVAIANATTAAMEAPNPAVATSRYRTFDWMSPQEMLRLKLPYDPTMSGGTRYAIQQAVNDNLADKGFQRGEPADFVIALSDVYFDNNRQAPGFGVLGEEFTLNVDSQGTQSGAYMNQEEYKPASERLTFIFLDAKTYKVLWAGSGNDVLTGLEQTSPRDTGEYYLGSNAPKQSGANIDAAVDQALATMPVPLPSPQ